MDTAMLNQHRQLADWIDYLKRPIKKRKENTVRRVKIV